MLYDTIIVGAGAAGCSAAIYATRFSLKTLMLGGPMPGGLITEALEVENYPGYLSVGGPELAQKFIDQAVKLGSEYKVEVVDEIILPRSNEDKPAFKVKTSSGEYEGKSIILATGTHHRKLGIPGETKFTGRGVSYCATCDGPLFKGKVVAVVGGGNSAIEGARDVAVHAKKVYLIYRSGLNAAPLYIEQMRQKENIEEIPSTNALEIKGDKAVKLVKLDKVFKGSNSLAVDGVFVQIGYVPKNDLAKAIRVELTQYGYVKVDVGMGTSKKGIFCAGDLNNASNQLHQQVTSAAEGAIAAQSAYRYLQGLDYIMPA